MSALRVPFALRRPWLLVRDLIVDRKDPALDRLRAIEDPESFVWSVLPHAARTFSASIALLPGPIARATAVAYLYCRILDSYEDLAPTRESRERSLSRFVARFEPILEAGSAAAAAPECLDPADHVDGSRLLDGRDRAHALLVERCELVDRVYLSLEPAVRVIIAELVRGMGEGMIRCSAWFEDQGGVLRTGEQLREYCRAVLGLPILYATRVLRWHHAGTAEVSGEDREDAMLAGEFIQLANVTRDIEKDLARGVAYDPELAADLGREDPDEPELSERIRRVRTRLLDRALALGDAYRRMLESIPLPALSLGRASGVLMWSFTERHYRGCARRVGLDPWEGPGSGWRVVLGSLPAAVSRNAARRKVRSDVEAFERFLERRSPGA